MDTIRGAALEVGRTPSVGYRWVNQGYRSNERNSAGKAMDVLKAFPQVRESVTCGGVARRARKGRGATKTCLEQGFLDLASFHGSWPATAIVELNLGR